MSAADEIAARTPAARMVSQPLVLMQRVLRKGRHSPAMTAPSVPKMNGTVSTRKSRPRRTVV
eukprot:278810-Rhodomonas_salina.1